MCPHCQSLSYERIQDYPDFYIMLCNRCHKTFVKRRRGGEGYHPTEVPSDPQSLVRKGGNGHGED